jgi:diacylglycerol kinase (ATP)
MRSARLKVPHAGTALVVNPNSCSGLTGKNWDDLYSKIKGIFGDDITVAFSKRTGHGTILTRDFLRKGFPRVVAIGGDGTINEVANGFFEESGGIRKALRPVNPDAVMGIVPCGTRNVLVKSLGLPAGVVECCRNFAGGSETKMDVIAVSATNPDDGSRMLPRVFLNAAEIGVAAEIIDRSKKVRSKVKSRLVSTITAVVATLPTYESNLCEFTIDRKKLLAKTTMAVVANGRFLGGGFMAAPDADVSDGLLDLVVLKNSGSFKMLDELASIKSGNHVNEDNITYTQARRIAIKSKERDVTVTIDGEPIGILPATFQVLPRALNVVM